MKKKSMKGEDISNATLEKIHELYTEMQEAKTTGIGVSIINRFLIVFRHHLNGKDIIKIINVIMKIVKSKGIIK